VSAAATKHVWCVEVRDRNFEPWELLFAEPCRSRARFFQKTNARALFQFTRIVKYRLVRA